MAHTPGFEPVKPEAEGRATRADSPDGLVAAQLIPLTSEQERNDFSRDQPEREFRPTPKQPREEMAEMTPPGAARAAIQEPNADQFQSKSSPAETPTPLPTDEELAEATARKQQLKHDKAEGKPSADHGPAGTHADSRPDVRIATDGGPKPQSDPPGTHTGAPSFPKR